MAVPRKIDHLSNIIADALTLFCPRRLRVVLFQHVRSVQGIKGQLMRLALIKTLAKNCGSNVIIHEDVYLFHTEGISLGNDISIDSMSHIDGAGGLDIGNNVMMAHSVTIRSTSHEYGDPVIPMDSQGYSFDRTVISDNVWLGAKSTILSGITIGTGSIVGANAVVTKSVPPDTVVGGCPARVLKRRL